MSKKPSGLAKKRKQNQKKEDKVLLERVLGLTCINGNSLSVTSETCIAYPAGSTLVLYYPKRNKYSYIINPSKKPLSCVCLSSDSKYIAYGEYGHSPCVHVWDITVSPPTEIAKLQGHAFGITCLCFSPNLRYLISVGYHHDQNINIWNWRSGVKIATNKITSKVYSIAYAEDGSYFVTAGNRRIRYWYFDTSLKNKSKQTLPLNGRSAILGEHQNNCFVAVKCGRGHLASYTYVLTQSGLLCQFNESRELDKLTDVKSGKGYCLELSEEFVLCGCSDGVIRLFDPTSLDYIMTIPRPHPLGINPSSALDSTQFRSQSGQCADTMGMGIDCVNKKLVVIYNDHSLYIWDIKNISQIGKTHSFLYHNACIWNICMYPLLEMNGPHHLPVLSYVSCSSDNTIRFWSHSKESGSDLRTRNIYSKDVFNILYTDSDTSCLKDFSKAPGDASAVADTSRGVRCIQFHPLGHHLAVGDRLGNLRVYDLQFMDKIVEIMAHDSEILSLQYSPLNEQYPMFLATGSRDRLIHIFDVSSNYNHLCTIDDHSASITAINFSISRDTLQLFSCGADKSLMFHSLDKSTTEITFKRTYHVAEKASMYDMIVDPTAKFIATASQDKLLRIYSIATGKHRLAYKACDDEGSTGLLKLTLDPSGMYIAVSGADKTVYLLDFFSGECIAKLWGHSEVVTALQFSSDCTYLYTASGDSCIFVWKLADELTQNMRTRLLEIGQTPFSISPQPVLPVVSPEDIRRETYNVIADSTDSSDNPEGFRFSVTKLPVWAQKQIYSRPSIAANVGVTVQENVVPVKTSSTTDISSNIGGKWAERVVNEIMLDERVASPGTGSESSEAEIEELTLELNKILSSDHQGTSIDEIKNNEEVTEVENEETVEEEVVYPYSNDRDSVDPSMFTVTTPERKVSVENITQSTTDEDEESGDSACSTPEFPRSDLGDIIDETVFLRTNFESLTTEKADTLFTPPTELESRLSPERPSISTLYFSRSCTTRGHKVRSVVTSPPAPITFESPEIVEQEDPSKTSKDPSSDEVVSKEDSSELVIEEVTDELINLSIASCDSHLTEPNESISRPRPHPIMETKPVRSKITEEEISKARKRLEQLGYPVSSKHQSQTKTDDVTKDDDMSIDCEKIPENIDVDITQEIQTLSSQISSLISQLLNTPHKVTTLNEQEQTHVNNLIKQTISSLTSQLQTGQEPVHNSPEIIVSSTTSDQSPVAMATQSLDPSVLSLLERYSDKLVDIVKDKVKS